MSEQLVKKEISKLIKSDDTGLLEIPTKLFHPYRILILKILYLHGYADFRQLKYDLTITDGNLASHLRALEQEGYIEVSKKIVDRKPRTTYTLTTEGLEAFEKFRKYIREVIESDFKG